MKPYLALAIISLWMLCCNLFASQAEELLKEPRLSQVLDSLEFSPVYGGFRISVSYTKPKLKNESYYIEHYYGKNPLKIFHGKLLFHYNDKIVKEIDLPEKEIVDFKISRNGQFCFLQNGNNWDLFNVKGIFLRTYKIEDKYKRYSPLDVLSNGNAILCLSGSSEGSSTGKTFGVVIINANSQVVYDDPEYQYLEQLNYSTDGYYYAFLKHKTKSGIQPPAEAETNIQGAILQVYNSKFQKIYEHEFEYIPNQKYLYSNICNMSFIEHTLILAIGTETLDLKHPEDRMITDYNFSTVHIDKKQIYWSAK
jgi:hypothetical protein